MIKYNPNEINKIKTVQLLLVNKLRDMLGTIHLEAFEIVNGERYLYYTISSNKFKSEKIEDLKNLCFKDLDIFKSRNTLGLLFSNLIFKNSKANIELHVVPENLMEGREMARKTLENFINLKELYKNTEFPIITWPNQPITDPFIKWISAVNFD